MCVEIGELLKQGAEALDVTARCLALGYVSEEIRQAFEEYRDENAA